MNSPNLDHRAPPCRQGEKHRQESRRPGSRALPSRTGRRFKLWKFEAHKWEEFTARLHTAT